MESTHLPLRKAVFPVAGLGTRFLPATKASPKEMLPVVNKPLIQYAVEEAYAAGIRQMIFVTCHNKHAIEDHFDISAELEAELLRHQKTELLSLVRAITPEDMEFFYVRQYKSLGLGHAVLCAETLVGKEPFAVLLADDLIISQMPVMKQMMEIYAETGANILAVQEIPMELTKQYGVVQGESINRHLIAIQNVVEKPEAANAPSNIGIVGRYILNPTIFEKIRTISKIGVGEVQLTDAIGNLLKEESTLAYKYEGTRYDCGSVLGFLKANVELGKVHPNEGENFTKWLQASVNEKNQ